MKKRVIIGWGHDLTANFFRSLFDYRCTDTIFTSKKKVESVIKRDKKNGWISKNSKPKIFKLIIETE